MNTQKIQTIKNVKGFTLVELIVVITILVILGTIAFLNLGGMSAGARDSQRTSDLTQINQQIMTTQAKQGISYIAMLSGTTNVLSGVTASIGGATGTTTSDYNAGDVNYTVLGIDKTKFQDPTSLVAYKMGATTRVGTAYEIAAKLEESSTALVMGIYKARDNTSTSNTASGIVTASGTTSLTVVLSTADIGKFKLNDVLFAASPCLTSAKISAISNDLTTLTLTCGSTAGGNFAANALKLASAEVAGLIGTGSTNVVTNKGTILPY